MKEAVKRLKDRDKPSANDAPEKTQRKIEGSLFKMGHVNNEAKGIITIGDTGGNEVHMDSLDNKAGGLVYFGGLMDLASTIGSIELSGNAKVSLPKDHILLLI